MMVAAAQPFKPGAFGTEILITSVGSDLDRCRHGCTLFGLALVFGGAFLLIRRELRLRTAAVTELRSSQASLTLSEQRLKTITDNVPAMIGYVDRCQTYRFVNAEDKSLFPGERTFLGKTT